MFEVCYDGTTFICVQTETASKYGIVGIKENSFYCFSCRKNLCSHAQVLSRLIDKDLSTYPDVVERLVNQITTSTASRKRIIRGPKVLSYKKINFKGDEALAEILNDNLRSVQKDSSGHLQLFPEEDTCKCGSPLQDASPVENGWIAYHQSSVITNSEILTANGNANLNIFLVLG